VADLAHMDVKSVLELALTLENVAAETYLSAATVITETAGEIKGNVDSHEDSL
jgi:hypothetical protein